MSIVIFSRVDGRRRGGRAHPAGGTEYPAGTFTLAQLHEIAADSQMAIARGPLVTIESIAEMQAAEAAEMQERDPAEMEDAPEMQEGDAPGAAAAQRARRGRVRG